MGRWKHRVPQAPPDIANTPRTQGLIPLSVQHLDVARVANRLEASLERLQLRTDHQWWEVAFCPRRRKFFYYLAGEEGREPWRQWDHPGEWRALYEVRVVILSTNDDA